MELDMSDHYYGILKNQIRYLYEDILKSTIVYTNYYLMIKFDDYTKYKGVHTNIPLSINGMSHLKSIMQPKALSSEVTCTPINNKNACHILNSYSLSEKTEKIVCKDVKELRQLYKKLSIKYHPDKIKLPNPDKNTQDNDFKTIENAYKFITQDHEVQCDIKGKIQSYLLCYYDNNKNLFSEDLKNYCVNKKDDILCDGAFNYVVEDL
jgi:hypothetical protein